MLYNSNGSTSSRLIEFDAGWLPTTWFDGGHDVVVGGTSYQPTYTNRINAAGARSVNDMELILDVEWLPSGHLGIDVTVTCNTFINAAPEQPSPPAGPTTGTLMTEYAYTGSTTDAESDQLYYMWDWGDGEMSDWLGPYNSGDTCEASHSWTVSNTYQIKIKAKDALDAESDWSSAKWAFFEGVSCTGKCGDANGDNSVNVSDAVFVINYVFTGGDAPIPLACGDGNGDGSVNVSDAVFVINYVFTGGDAPGLCAPGDPDWTDGDCCEFTP